MRLKTADVDAICGLVNDLCGIALDESKAYLIESRLADLTQRSGCESYADLARRARLADTHLQREIINAITTRETSFFRDGSPFEALEHKVIPDLLDGCTRSSSRRLRIWSAACSTGQEPYSIAMILRRLLSDLSNWDIRILATDISDAAIAKASRGVFADHETIRGLREEVCRDHFERHADGWQVKDELRSLVSFRQLNLLDPFPFFEQFDVIFCRNVAIYFEPEKRRDLFVRLAERLLPDGYLFTGSSESLSDIGARFRAHHHCRGVFYRPNQPVATSFVS